MQREGQPRGIQRLFHKMKRAEMQRRAEPRPTNLRSERVQQPQPARQPTWENHPLLDQAAKERIRAELRAFDEKVEQSMKEHRESRYNQGTPWKLEDWLAYREMKKSQETYNLAPLAPEQQTPEKVKSPAQRKVIAAKMYKQLVKEVEDRQLVEGAKILRREVWGDDPESPRAKVQRYGDMHVTMNTRTGQVKDRSQVGIALADPTEERRIYYGIGYFENEENFIPVARGSVSPQDRQKGTKAYFIEQTHGGRKELIIIPFAYAEATSEFYNLLHGAAVDLAPSDTRHHRQADAKQQIAA